MNSKTCISLVATAIRENNCYWDSFGKIKFDLTMKKSIILYLIPFLSKLNEEKLIYLFSFLSLTFLLYVSVHIFFGEKKKIG